MSFDHITGRLVGGEHRLPVRVYYEDTDAGGIIYHAAHVRFFERGRTEFLRALDLEQSHLHETEGMLFVVRHMEIDFLRPGRLDDVLVIGTQVGKLGGSTVLLDQTVTRDGDTLATAAVTCVAVGATGRPVRLPSGVRQRFADTVAS